jgi:hypothetical protein
MDREEEYLLHIAAGTDPITALAALPDEPEGGPPRRKPSGALGCGLLAAVAVMLWFLLR